MSLPPALALSPSPRVAIKKIGAEQNAVAVIDNALAAPAAAVDLAATQTFTPIGPYYPGVRAPLGGEAAAAFGQALAPVIADALGLSAPRWTGEAFFSIVTTPPARLAPIQRLPHFDGLEETRVAALLYLAGSEFGGTSFYRHRETGFEAVTSERYPRYGAALQADVARHGLPPADYIGDGAPMFDEIATFEPAFNRLLLYRGNVLHCSRMKNADTLSPDPTRGRLTINLFLQPA
ncbi:MAG: DUF6445 family protein [Parvularculaceae bacterium]|nr:DUF6445 family protein [Parvularculaceae bacterium]